MKDLPHFIFEHRRILAAVSAGLAVLFTLGALRAEPPGEELVVANRDLAVGDTIQPGDLTTLRVEKISRHLAADVSDLVGRQLASPVRAGEPFSDWRFLGADLLAGYGEGYVLSTIEADPSALATLNIGDLVTVVAADPGSEAPATVVARRVRVATFGKSAHTGATTLGVAVDEKTALSLADASMRARLTVFVSD